MTLEESLQGIRDAFAEQKRFESFKRIYPSLKDKYPNGIPYDIYLNYKIGDFQ